MKTNLKFIFSFFVFALLASNCIAQSTVAITPAHSTSDGVITFDTTLPLSGVYEFDFSDFNYSEVEAQRIAGDLQEMATGLNTQLDYPNQKIIIMIDMTDPEVSEWDVKAWNDHLIEVQKEN